MADRRQLEILQDGPETWHTWRRRNRAVVPDLSEANLKDYKLRGANFAKSNITSADLRHANASGANLREANLTQSQLVGADLKQTNLSGADLRGALVERRQLLIAKFDAKTRLPEEHKWMTPRSRCTVKAVPKRTEASKGTPTRRPAARDPASSWVRRRYS